MIDRYELDERGFTRWQRQLCEGSLRAIAPLFDDLGTARAGYRLAPSRIATMPAIAPVIEAVGAVIGRTARPVRALLFDKRATGNWALGWHQDRTIEVRQRIDTPGFGPWTCKGGRAHVAPPIALLKGMLTVRIHLDAVDAENAPLLVAPGSHRLGIVQEARIAEVVERCGTIACLADVGDVWLYATPILHASDRAVRPRHRRVVQIDFAATDLPNGLEWASLAHGSEVEMHAALP